MVVGRDTFTGDLLARAGLSNVFASHADRYPSLDLGVIDGAGADAVLLPDEPYVFTTPMTGPRRSARPPRGCVSGRLITWYGPSLVEAHPMLQTLLPDDPSDHPSVCDTRTWPRQTCVTKAGGSSILERSDRATMSACSERRAFQASSDSTST